MIKTVQKLEEVIDFVWELSQDKLYASYPRLNLIENLKKEIEKAINKENFNIIACYQQNVLSGVCFYFWETDERHAQTVGFLIKEDYGKIADEFIDYISKQLPGYELFIGVPLTNKSANEYFKERNIECIEDSIVTRICNLEQHTNQIYDYIEKVNKDNFEEYALFHDKYAIPLGMYFNSKNLIKAIQHFRIFAFKQDGAIHGSIFVNADKEISDVVGLFIDKEYKNKDIEYILINEMLTQLYNEFGTVKEILYFIDEGSDDELNIALSSGFEIKERYRLYKYIF